MTELFHGQNNLSQSRKEHEDAEIENVKWKGKEVPEHPQSQDPMHDWHTKDGQKSKSLEITEDEILAIENSPEYKATMKFAKNEVSNVDDLGSLQGIDFSDKIYKELEEGKETSFEDQGLKDWIKPTEKVQKDTESLKTKTEGRYEYSKTEFNLMKQCANYCYEYSINLNKSYPHPTFTDGSRMSKDDILELSREYFQLKHKSPKVFAKLKAEVGDWQKKELTWQPDKNKPGQEWIAFTLDALWVSEEDPNMFLNDGGYYYTKERSYAPKDKNSRVKEVSRIKLHMPIDKKAGQN